MGAERQRRRAAVENDARILRAAIEMIDEVGVDRITTVGVAKRAGLTTGAMYARYEHQNELLADLWQRAGLAAVRMLVDAAVRASRSGGADAADLIGLLEAHPADLRVGVELLAVSRRVDELADVVSMDLAELLAEHGMSSEALRAGDAAVTDLGMVTLALGCVLGAHVIAHESIHIPTAIMRLCAAEARPDDGSLPDLQGVTLVGAPHPAADQDEVLTALVSAAETVIARVGVHRATLSSVGRVARVVPTLVYSRFANRDDLMADVLRRVQSVVITAESQAIVFHGVPTMTATMRLWQTPELTVTRRFRREMFVATRCEPQWLAIAGGVDATARAAAADALVERYGSRQGVIAMLCVGGMGSEGVSLLLDAGVDLGGIDWTPLAEQLFGFGHAWSD